MTDAEPVKVDGEILGYECPECSTMKTSEAKALDCCAGSPVTANESDEEGQTRDATPGFETGESGSLSCTVELDAASVTERDVFPADLDASEQWHAWKPTSDGRKVPRAPWVTGGDAFVSAQDADVWTDRGTAAKWCEHLSGYGLAVNIRDREEHPNEDVVLIDFDNARNPETERIHPAVRRLIERAGSYADVSTSGTGVHILLRAPQGLPEGVKAIDAELPDDPEGDLNNAEIEVYDSGRFVAMTGKHLAATPAGTREAQGFVDDLADEYATVAEGTPDELTREPEKSREQLADVETTDDIQDIFDAIQHTGPRDIHLRSSVTHERGDGSKSLDPSWADSKSGSRLAQVGDGWVYRKGMRGLDALQVVALEERIIVSEDEYPDSEEFWQAVDALRERGAHIPEYDGPETGEAEPVAVLPNSPRAQAAANGWDWMSADRAGVEGALTQDEAHERTRDAIGDAYGSVDLLVEALPTLGKSYGSVAAAADTGEPITILTGRGNKEQYDQLREWCEEHGLRAKVMPSFLRDCETANGEHGEAAKETVREWYHRGATGKDIHVHYENETGQPIPCDGPAGARCSYKAGWQFDADEYDVLIGHYLHGHVKSATSGRTVVFDEFPGSAFETVLSGSHLAGAVTRYLKTTDALPFDDYAELLAGRDDPERRADALAWFTDHDPDRDAVQALSTDGHALAPIATFTLLGGAETDLGNGWERASLPEGGVGLFDREHDRVHLLQPPDLEYTRSTVGLDGTPTPRMWELALGKRLNHRQVLTDDERVEYIRDTLSLNFMLTTEYVKSYNSETHVNPENDAALLDAIADEHGRAPALLTTMTGERVHENAGLYETDGDGDLVDGKGRVSGLAHHGNLLGSNRFGSERLGAVIGSNHYGDGFIEKWGAYAGESVERDGDGKGADLSYTGIGEDVHRHMTEHQTLQAAMRFGRDGGGATVYVHTNTLPEWVTDGALAGEGRVLRTYSDGERQVLDALDSDAIGEEWTTGEVAEHPAVEVSDRQVRSHLHRLAERGFVDVDVEGNGFVWRDGGLHRVGEHGEVELEPVELDELTEQESAEVTRSSSYTWNFRTSRPSSGDAGDEPTGSERTAVETDGGGDPPPDMAD